MKYWIERWSQLRKKGTHEELKSGFKELHEIFMHCYEDILNDPAGMLLPIYDMNEYGY